MDKCIRNHTIQALRFAAGWYVGTIDEDGFPYCRISAEYYRSQQECQTAIDNDSYMQRTCMENQFCNGGHGCLR